MRKIKRVLLTVTVVAAILFLGSCTVWQMFFGPDKNSIDAWWPKDFKIGTILTYKYHETYTTSEYNNTDTFTIEITDIDERETRTVIKTVENGNVVYLIVDKDKGEIVRSSDTTIDDNDEVVLKTPVEEGTTWYNWTNSKYTIDEVKSSKTVEAGTFDDAVVVKVSDPDWQTITSVHLYYSVTGGNLGWTQTFNPDVSYYGITESGIELTNIDKP